jgi:hypothetical protein
VDETEEWEVVREALRAEGVDPTDLARFVNVSHPGLPGFEPERFDVQAAYPVLLALLQRVKSRAVTETPPVASRKRVRAAILRRLYSPRIGRDRIGRSAMRSRER